MVDGVTNSTNGASLAGALTGGTVMGKDDFLRLLVTQLQNQDPLNPQDPTEFTAQLAQFSSLEQLFSVNDNLAQMAQSSRDSSHLDRLSALSMIGREIEVSGPDFHYNGGDPVEFGYTLDSAAPSITVKVVDGNGRVVAALSKEDESGGVHRYSWDGTGLNGQAVPAGDYRFQVERLDGDTATAVSTRIGSMVTGVDLSGQGSVLNTAAGDFSLEQVLNVRGA